MANMIIIPIVPPEEAAKIRENNANDRQKRFCDARDKMIKKYLTTSFQGINDAIRDGQRMVFFATNDKQEPPAKYHCDTRIHSTSLEDIATYGWGKKLGDEYARVIVDLLRRAGYVNAKWKISYEYTTSYYLDYEYEITW